MCDRSMGADMQAWAARGYSASSEIVAMRQNGLRNGEPSRLARARFLVRTMAATVVRDDRAVIKITTPSSDAKSARIMMDMINREVQLGAVLCDAPEPDIVGITTMWTIPAILPDNMKMSPLRQTSGTYSIAVRNDYTQLLPADAAAQARRSILHVKYRDKLRAGQPRDSPGVRALRNLAKRAQRGDTDAAYIEYLTPRAPMQYLLATEQPLVDGVTLRDILLGGSWAQIRPALRASIAALERLQRTRHLQHGDFSPSNIIITPAGNAVLIDLARAWMAGATLDTRGVTLPTRRAARGFDLRFFGVWLAATCAETRDAPAELRAVAAALVVPSRIMTDEARLGRIWYVAGTYEFHGPRHASFAEYVHGLMALAAWLLAGTVDDAPRQFQAAQELLFDVGPWTAAAAACTQWRMIDDAADLCAPANALLLDLLQE